MAIELPKLYLVRHGDTEWTETRRHTGRMDIPLNADGELHARQLAEILPPVFTHVFASPLQRARRTCELAGFGEHVEINLDLLEWDYGLYEGKTTPEIQKERPGWEMFRDGCPDGESAVDVAQRADRFIRRVRDLGVNVLAFAHGHIIHMIAARWLGLDPAVGRCFFCRPGSIGELGYEHGCREQPILLVWNYVHSSRG